MLVIVGRMSVLIGRTVAVGSIGLSKITNVTGARGVVVCATLQAESEKIRVNAKISSRCCWNWPVKE